MDKLILNVYNENDEIIKTSEARFINLRFGTVRSLMELLNVDNIEDTSQLLKKVYEAWDQITKVLQKVFPDLTEEDWDGVKLSELLPIVIAILKNSFTQILSIPSDSKNSIAE